VGPTIQNEEGLIMWCEVDCVSLLQPNLSQFICAESFSARMIAMHVSASSYTTAKHHRLLVQDMRDTAAYLWNLHLAYMLYNYSS
jgi:hypothetical protein